MTATSTYTKNLTVPPKYGAWFKRSAHKGSQYEYQSDWLVFVYTNPFARKTEILDFGRMLGKKYGFRVNY